MFDDIAHCLKKRALELLKQYVKSVFYEPLARGAAYAIAAVLDRARYNTIRANVAREALRRQAANLAAASAARAPRWNEFRSSLPAPDIERPIPSVPAAIAQGWDAKWT